MYYGSKCEIQTFTKHVKRKWSSPQDRDATVKRFYDQLIMKEKDVPTTSANLLKLGIGRGTISAYKKRDGGINEQKDSSDDSKGEDVPVIIRDRALRDPVQSTAQLNVGTKVIAITNPNATENAKRQQLKRARDTFGDENVIATAEDCKHGEILKKQKVKTNKGTTITRDLCIEDR